MTYREWWEIEHGYREPVEKPAPTPLEEALKKAFEQLIFFLTNPIQYGTIRHTEKTDGDKNGCVDRVKAANAASRFSPCELKAIGLGE